MIRLNLWHKTLIVGVALLPFGLWLTHSDMTVSGVEYAGAVGSVARSYRVTNDMSGDSLVDIFGVQLKKFMRRERLRGGVSVAISKGGRLVFAKGFGYSDVEDSVEMEPWHVMRVASVSKLITAVAVMRLVESGRLVLDQKVFGPTGVLNDNVYLSMRDPRMGRISVRNLLDHSGGWSTEYGDPMFMAYTVADGMGRELPVTMEDIIRYMQGKKLHFEPGAYSSYSNFGYGVLGEVVAKASGVPYEDYVRSEVLGPLGVYDAHVGYSHREDRLEGEVSYYEPDTAYRTGDYADRGRLSRRSYGGSDIHTLGSAGGWVISSVDLVKLMLTIDGFESVRDQLSALSVGEMTDPWSRKDPLGWRKVVVDAWFRTGTLSATCAALCRRPDGICFAVTMNSSNGLGPNLAVELTNRVNELINRVAVWPDYDLLAGDERWEGYKRMGR